MKRPFSSLSVGETPLKVLTGLVFALSASATHAVPITWTDWTSADGTSASGFLDGITVMFDGVLNPPAQTAGGIFYWGVSPSTYTSPPVVDNPPPDSDIIRLVGGTGAGTQTITFSQPVDDPVMAILSLGQPGFDVDYVFGDEDFTVLNSGPGFFIGGPLVELAGNVLRGTEGHGIIQFNGSFSSIDWTIPIAENWHGFQIGIAQEPGPSIPEPTTLALLGVGLAGLGLARRRRRSK